MKSVPKNLLVITFLLSSILFSFSFAQTQRWVYRYNGTRDTTDLAYAITLGMENTIHVACGSCDDSEMDFVVISLNSTGNEQWVYRYNGSANSYDCARAIVCGADSCIYVAGLSSSASLDFTVISLNSSGDERWIYQCTSGVANAITYGSDDDIYVAGYTRTYNTWQDFTVISLNNQGDSNWVYRFNGVGNMDDVAVSITYGMDGSIYAAGYTHTGWGQNYDIFVVSLAADGSERWTYMYDSPGSHDEDKASSIVYGPDGNIYVTGYCHDSITGDDIIVVSLNSDGVERWIHKYSSPGYEEDKASSIVCGSDSDVFITGHSPGINHWDMTVMGLSTMGDSLWMYKYNGPSDDGDFGIAITYGDDGNIYTVGRSFGGFGDSTSTWDDFTVVSLTPAGTERWVYRYNGTGNYRDMATGVVFGQDGYLYTTGWSYGDGTNEDIVVISLDPITAIEEGKVLVRKNDKGATIISGPLLLPEDKKYQIFDITGRSVIPDRMRPGIYFIEIDGRITGKVVKVK